MKKYYELAQKRNEFIYVCVCVGGYVVGIDRIVNFVQMRGKYITSLVDKELTLVLIGNENARRENNALYETLSVFCGKQ